MDKVCREGDMTEPPDRVIVSKAGCRPLGLPRAAWEGRITNFISLYII